MGPLGALFVRHPIFDTWENFAHEKNWKHMKTWTLVQTWNENLDTDKGLDRKENLLMT